MATTTNYSWTTPDDTDLVKDGAAAIRTLGSSIDTTTKALNPSTTLGDIEYRSSTANTNTRLGIGSTGNVLTVTGGVPVWAAPASGGKVLQVIQATTTTATSSTTGSFVDTTLTATITPSSATSKVLVLLYQPFFLENLGNSSFEGSSNIKLVRASTDIVALTDEPYRFLAYRFADTSYISYQLSALQSIVYLDSPATTSATTYKTQFNSGNTGLTITVQKDSMPASIILMEIGA
jgi:hypothetical protein